MKRFIATVLLTRLVQSQVLASVLLPQGTLIVVQPQQLIDA